VTGFDLIVNKTGPPSPVIPGGGYLALFQLQDILGEPQPHKGSVL